MKKLSRMESNKEARRVLNRHQVDLGYCSYSCYGKDVMLSGSLYKTDGTDFNGPQIQSLVEDFGRHLPGYTVFGDFDNWSFNSERITFLGDRKEHSEAKGNGGDQEQVVYEIDIDYDSEAS